MPAQPSSSSAAVSLIEKRVSSVRNKVTGNWATCNSYTFMQTMKIFLFLFFCCQRTDFLYCLNTKHTNHHCQPPLNHLFWLGVHCIPIPASYMILLNEQVMSAQVHNMHMHGRTHVCSHTHTDFRSYLPYVYYLVTDKRLSVWTWSVWKALYTREKSAWKVNRMNQEDEVRI